MKEAEIERLIRQASSGDREAADVLARRYEGPLREWIHRRLGPELRAQADTEDLLQSTIVAALDDLPGLSFRGEDAFVAWLAAVAERRILMKARHHRARKRDVRRQRPMEAAAGVPGDFTSPTQGAVRRELAEGIERALKELPPRERRVVELHSFQGRGFDEVAQELGLSGKSAAYRIFERALKNLGRLLDAPEEAEG